MLEHQHNVGKLQGIGSKLESEFLQLAPVVEEAFRQVVKDDVLGLKIDPWILSNNLFKGLFHER